MRPYVLYAAEALALVPAYEHGVVHSILLSRATVPVAAYRLPLGGRIQMITATSGYDEFC